MLRALKRCFLYLKQLDDSTKNWNRPGGWFDATTYAGNARTFAVGIALLLAAQRLDHFGRWLWRQFGQELIQSKGAESTHLIVLSAYGAILCGVSLARMIAIYCSRRNRH
jgi:ABC-type multidrug transport system fused ATPase/permease subunit